MSPSKYINRRFVQKRLHCFLFCSFTAKKCMKAKNFYRSNELALWLKLIPKFNRRGDNGEEIVNDLEESANRSTYDDPGRLLNNFYTFPPSPIPPQPPRDWTGWPQETTESTSPSTPKKAIPTPKPTVKEEPETPEPDPVSESTDSEEVGHSAVPLSITVAVGCALIFLNLLICAGMYYQRERIKKLREAPPRGGSTDMNDTRNNDRNKPRDPTPAEAINLVHSQPETTLPKVANMNHKPHMDHVPPVYSAIAKPVATPQIHGGYSYSALSQTSSPMHSHNQIHFAAQNPRTGPPSEDGSQASSTKGHNSSARPPGPDRSPKMDPRLKHITRGGQQVTSNNAITIV